MAQTVIRGQGTLAVGTTSNPSEQFECQVADFTIEAQANQSQIPATYCQGPGVASQQSTFTCNMSYLQDWGATPSLSQLLFDNDGQLLHFTFTPTDTNVPKADGQFYATASSYGGAAQEPWQHTGQMGMPAAPTLTPQP